MSLSQVQIVRLVGQLRHSVEHLTHVHLPHQHAPRGQSCSCCSSADAIQRRPSSGVCPMRARPELQMCQ
ncbi:hypothetical protein EJB05_44581, partial [Eragrostis curvula]